LGCRIWRVLCGIALADVAAILDVVTAKWRERLPGGRFRLFLLYVE